MAEAIGLVANIIAVIQISETVIKVCKFYIESLHDAPSDLRAILIETSALKTILENLQFLLKCGGGDGLSKMLDTYNLFGVEGPIEGCQRTVGKIERLFPTPTSSSSKIRSAYAALGWPLKESKARKLLTELVQYKTTINLAIDTDSSQDIKEIKKKTIEMHAILTESQRNEIYQWLSTTDPSPLHHRAMDQYEPQTGDWMLRSPEWRDWIDGKNRCLWIHGIPGAGKTVLVSHLIENVKYLCQNRRTKRCTYAYYYCYFGHNQDEAAPFLRWALNRLCREAETIPAAIYNIVRKGEQPSVVDLLNALESVLDEFDMVYLFLDAIDESMPRKDLLKVLRDLSTDSRFEKIQLLATSRQYLDIEETMQDISVPVSMSNPLLDEDIRLYVRARVDTHPRLKGWSVQIRDEVVEALSNGAKGMFRWAVCQIDALQRLKPQSHIVRNALKNLPRTLDETYERIFMVVPNEDRLLVRFALQWIWFHKWLRRNDISVHLLLQAIEHCILESDPSKMELCYNQDALRDICGCLIMVTKSRSRRSDSEDSYDTVSFAHYTVKEFLDSSRILTSPANFFAMKEKDTKLALMRATLLEVTRNPEYDTWRVFVKPERAHFREFNPFCNVAVMWYLENNGEDLAEDTSLLDLISKLLDTSQPHFQRFANILENYESTNGATFTNGSFDFWDIKWNNPPSTSGVAPLLSLLTWFGGLRDKDTIASVTEVAKKILEKIDTRALSESVVDIRNTKIEQNPSNDAFRGSIVEYLARRGYVESYYGAHKAFWFLMEHAADFIDPSKTLLALLASHIQCSAHHWGDGSSEKCPLARMLKLGASANAPGYKVTPLQIAVKCRDFNGVKFLLEAGADVNGTGDCEGVEWNADSYLSIFNHLHGMRPLEIVRPVEILSTTVDGFSAARGCWNVELETKIQQILIQYGATSDIPATTTKSATF
ncbi:hypothetical protein BU16DRAFT_522834 [Lophium mytilinum]|uniref:NACHT domain-containing protein n=1 Tax=Lophium mytilinum TaxID=390894 RepID=A0A6A6R5F3_9PEZI|nr:hypothetical protein BU16DRAFT_522834 [Lophium mytilinum]